MSLCSLSYLGGMLDRASAISCGSDAVTCLVMGGIISADSRYNLQTHQCANHISQTRPPSKTMHSTTTQRCQHCRQQPTNQNTSATSNRGSTSGTTCHEHTSTHTVQYSITNMATRHNPRICCGGYEAEMPSARDDAPHTQNHTIRE